MADFPYGKTAVAASSGNVAAATATASLPAVSGRLNYIAGFSVNGAGGTSVAVVNVTVTGLAAGTMTFPLAVAGAVTTGNQPLTIYFDFPLPASAYNTAITVSCPAITGGTNNAVNVWGYLI